MPQADEAIIEILKSLPNERPISIPPEYRVVRRPAVIKSGADPDAVEAWVRKMGGEVVRVPEPIPSNTALWRSKDGDVAYMVPRSALAEPSE